ncbi:MAG: hypothetical protein Q7S44_03445 [bacterium]|nr:hypothetical protein [bacterium]
MHILLKRKFTLILVFIIALLLAGSFEAYQRITTNRSVQTLEEVDLAFDAEGPYALLFPRRDGNALVLNIKRTASYDSISYELAYTSEGIDRGVMGNIDTKQKKGEYDQEILFGTCSKNVCKYDKGVENGTLTLHIKKGNKAYRMNTQWHLQQPDLALGVLSSGDRHLNYKIASGSSDLSLIKYTIINDLSGAPKLPDGKTVLGKVYAVNSPESKTLPSGTVTIELAENPPTESKIAKFDEVRAKWVEYETKILESTMTASVDSGGVLAVLIPKK